MVSWDCTSCGGSGKKEIIVIRDGEAEKETETCHSCGGSGHIRNGSPEWC